MNKKKTSSETVGLVKDPVFKKTVEDLTEAIIENLEELMQEDLEPFEAYANHIRHQVHHNLHQFRERFTSGYQTLLEEMDQNYPEKEK